MKLELEVQKRPMEASTYLNILIDWQISFVLSVAKYVIFHPNKYQ